MAGGLLPPRDALAVFLGGGAGACLRAALVSAFPAVEAGALSALHPGLSGFPLSTLLINCAGAFLLGLLLALLAEFGQDTGYLRSVRLALGTGLLGGFTTYSAFAVQGLQLILDGRWGAAGFYVALSLVLGFLLAAIGLRAGSLLEKTLSAGGSKGAGKQGSKA